MQKPACFKGFFDVCLPRCAAVSRLAGGFLASRRVCARVCGHRLSRVKIFFHRVAPRSARRSIQSRNRANQRRVIRVRGREKRCRKVLAHRSGRARGDDSRVAQFAMTRIRRDDAITRARRAVAACADECARNAARARSATAPAIGIRRRAVARAEGAETTKSAARRSLQRSESPEFARRREVDRAAAALRSISNQ